MKERVDASKTRIGRDEALALARSAARVLVARGRGVVEFNMQKNPPDDDTLAAHLLGRTGNLRAPTIRVGRTLLVGFSEEGYRHVF
ncbi:MAG: hypothetical protein HRF50_00870 [Phycisphaerae bacterium]